MKLHVVFDKHGEILGVARADTASPVRARPMPDEQAGQNPTSGALSATASRQLLAGDSLAGIAYQEYGSAALWRATADANRIDDPMRVAPGTNLLIPSITDAAG